MVIGFVACSQTEEGRQGRRGQNFDPEQMLNRQVERMTTALELDEDQQKAVKELYIKFNEKQSKAREELGGNREEMRESMQKIGVERESELEEILSSDQWVKWKEVREQFQQRRRRGQGS